jgi:crotonobetainyl-CoA:carnitine CoA-transferase CaiB-like acyl-CoA transferase
LACHADEFWAKLCGLIGRPDLLSDTRIATRDGRRDHQDIVYDAVGAFTSRHTRQELMGILGGHVPFGPVFNVADIIADPHFKAHGMVVELDQPGSPTKVAVAGVPVRMSETPGRVRRRAPLLGEDTDTVLAMIEQPPDAIARLRADGVVK